MYGMSHAQNVDTIRVKVRLLKMAIKHVGGAEIMLVEITVQGH